MIEIPVIAVIVLKISLDDGLLDASKSRANIMNFIGNFIGSKVPGQKRDLTMCLLNLYDREQFGQY